MFYFFFKQKTAYDMRISDWSSDVCSSDLIIQSVPVWQLHIRDQNVRGKATQQLATLGNRACGFHLVAAPTQRFSDDGADRLIVIHHQYASLGRSEEHTSELQSLMRLSYAVFCLKKQRKYTSVDNNSTHTPNIAI